MSKPADWKTTRRALLMSGTATLGLTACRTSSSAQPTPTAPQWLASKDLVGFGKPIDMAAMNKAAGMTSKVQRADPYGPYLPLALPSGHKIYASAPVDPDRKVLGSQPMEAWREMLRTAAPAFVTYMVDPDELWSHDKDLLDSAVYGLFNTLQPSDASNVTDVDSLYGKSGWMNFDGKLVERVGAAPAKRTTAGPRFGVQELTWSAIERDGRPALLLHAILSSPVTADGVTWRWDRVVELVWPVPETNQVTMSLNFPVTDQVSVPMRDPLHDLPRITIGQPVTGWTAQSLGKLSVGLPTGWTKTTSTDDAPGTLRFGKDGRYMTISAGPVHPVSWYALKDDTNTQFRLAGDIPVLAQWGFDTERRTYLCSSWIFAKDATYVVSFTTAPERAPQDLREHAATWKIAA